jgi:hypothetical protein
MSTPKPGERGRWNWHHDRLGDKVLTTAIETHSAIRRPIDERALDRFVEKWRDFGDGWRDADWTDQQAHAQLQRAVTHLGDALQVGEFDEIEKRGADVVNLVFMICDPGRTAVRK